jgi:hypothetical protein
MAGLISAIVPNRDGGEVIGACLRSLFAQTLAPAEVIVVDDCSRDDSPELVAREFPRARLLRLEASRGFAGACAEGLRAAGGQWIAVLNSDAEAEPGWLREALAAAALAADAAMIASRVLRAATGRVDSLGLYLRRSGLASLAGRDGPDAPDASLPRAEEVFGPAGAAALYRRDALARAGFFATDFFAYYEDVDLAWRLRRLGYRCLLAHRARVRHRHSYTADRLGIDKRYYLQRNRLRALARNWPLRPLLLYAPLILAADLGSIALAALEGKPLSALRARRDFLRLLPADLRARRELGGIPPELGRWLGRERRPFLPGDRP